MAVFSAGEARLAVIPDASGFRKRLEADMKRIDAEFRLPVTADVGQARADIERFRAEQQRNDIELKVHVDTRAATAEIGALERSLSRIGGGSGGGGLGALFTKPVGVAAGAVGIVGLLPALSSGIGQVVAAIEQLAGVAPVLPGSLAAIGAVAGTVKLGMSGVADAFDAVNKAADGTPKSIEAAQNALAALAPSAAQAVQTAVKLKNDLTQALTLPVQQNLFSGISESLQELYDSDIPVLQQRLPALASTLNEGIRRAFDSLGSDQSKGLLDRILGNTDEATGKLNNAINPIINAIGRITAAGSNALPRLADDIAGVADRFNRFITNAAQSGALDTFISNGITGFENIGTTVFNVGRALDAIAQAAGGDLLTNVTNVSQKFADWLNSTEGRQQLKDFLDEGKRQLSDIATIAKNLGPAFKEGFGGAAEAVGGLLSTLRTITGVFDSLPDWLKTALTKGISQTLNPVELIKQPFDIASHSVLFNPPSTPQPTASPGSTAPHEDITTVPSGSVPLNPLDILRGVPGRAMGGPTPSGRGYGPTGGWLAEVHSDEWVLPAHARATIGDRALWALTAGRSFAPGGFVDEHGNPITPGPAPGGPAPVAPNPAGGGLLSAFGAGLGGIGGALGNVINFASNIGGAGGGGQGGSLADRAAQIPGLWGLFGSLGSSDPNALTNWGTQTASWLGSFTAKVGGSFLSTLWQGGLDAIGLGGSILSPSNPWNRDLMAAAGFALDSSGPIGTLMGSGSGSSSASSSSSSVSSTDLAALQVPGVSHLPGGSSSRSGSSSGSSSGARGWFPAAVAAKAKGGNEEIVHAVFSQYFPESEWAAFRNLEMHEAGFNPTAHNASGAYGIGQFMPYTWGIYGTGPKTSDLTTQAHYMMKYIIGRYGTPTRAWAQYFNHPGGEGSYDVGGYTGDAPADRVAGVVHGGEFVVRKSSTDRIEAEYPGYLDMLNSYAVGGFVQGAVPQPPPFNPDRTPANLIRPQPVPAPAPRRALPAAPPATAAPPVVGAAPITPGMPEQPSQPTYTPPSVYTPTAPSISNDALNHNLPAIRKGIASTASVLGNVVATAAQLGMAAASMGGSGGGGGGGGGLASSLIAGAFQQGGKIVDDAVNVGSSFLVGNVPGPAYQGPTGVLRPAQNTPVTATDNSRNYVFNGIDGRNVADTLQLQDRIDQQAALAQWRG